MYLRKGNITDYLLSIFLMIGLNFSCVKDVNCPTGHLEAKEMIAKGITEKKRTENGLIKKKNPKKHVKRHPN
jgi:hypothetical protein